MSGFYQPREFAGIAGVTVKALHHYDRLGLLKPARSGSGYRRYTERDLERLEQIVALKFLGFPLKQIKAVLDRPPLDLADVLRLQRRAIEEKQTLLGRAIRAIQAAEGSIVPGAAAEPTIFRRIIEAINMQDGIEVMKRYYSTEEAWAMRRRYYEEGPSPEWRELYRDVGDALGEDPGSERAQSLAGRWLALSIRAAQGDPGLQTDSPTAWMDREHWPPAMKQRIAQFNLEEVVAFIHRAAVASRKKYFSPAAWSRFVELRTRSELNFSFSWQARVDLFRDIEAALGEDPAGAKARALAARWIAQIDGASGGDPEIKAGLMKAWADRGHWPATLRWQVQALHMMPYERFVKCADFIDQSMAS